MRCSFFGPLGLYVTIIDIRSLLLLLLLLCWFSSESDEPLLKDHCSNYQN